MVDRRGCGAQGTPSFERHFVVPPLLGLLLTLAACTGTGPALPKGDGGSAKDEASAASATARDPRWGVPLQRAGLPNLYRVSDTLYRGAQPEPAGFMELKKLGVKTVINLRSAHTDKDLMHHAGLAEDAFDYESIPMVAWHAEDEAVVRFLRLVTDRSHQPVFVHCQHGADRTGLMVAIYRIAVQGWSRPDAIQEMTQGGTGFHEVWTNLIDYLLKLDIARIQQQAGLPATAP